MKSRLLAGSVAAAALIFCASVSEAGVLVPIPSVPGSTETWVSDINNKNVVNGWYLTPDGVTHGFIGTLKGNYKTFDVAGAQDPYITEGLGLNDNGYMTVYATVINDDCFVQGCQQLRTSSGAIKPIMRAHHQLDGFPGQIIDRQKFVGQYAVLDQDENLFFYGYYGKGTKYVADLTLPFNTDRTRPRGYDTAGTVVGYFTDLDQHDLPGFVLKNGAATAVRYPDASALITVLRYMNRKEIVAGYWEDQDAAGDHPFLYNIATNAFLPTNVEGAVHAFGEGINNSGIMAITADGLPYIYCPKKKTCPLHSPNEKVIPERWISAEKFSRTLPCKNGCSGPHHGSSGTHDAAAVRAAIARDPELQRELGPPFRR